MDPIEEKIKIIENSYDAFIKEVKEIEDEVLKQILTFIKSFIEKPQGATLSTINKILKKIINPAKFKSSVRAYLKNFDQVEILSKKILSGEIGENLDDFNLNDEKKLAIEDIVKAVNQVGAAPGDLMAILEALKQSGALKAELVVI